MKILNSVPINNFKYKNDFKNEYKKHSSATNDFDFSSVSSNAIKSQALASINFTNKLDTTEEIIEKLSKEYGIEADLTSYPQAKMLYDTVLEFVELNDKNMFRGMIVKEAEMDDSKIWRIHTDYDKNEFVLTLNNKLDFDDYKNNAKSEYEDLSHSSDNPKYDFYRSLGSFLCFKYNPYAYTLNIRQNNFSNLLMDLAMQYSAQSLVSFQEFNSNYIATRMSGKWTAPKADVVYEDSVGPDLNFPEKPAERTGVYKKEYDFKDVEEANEYLKKYGIEADFPNVHYANLTCEAIEDFININNNDKMFNGLKIGSYVSSKTTTFAHVAWDYDFDTAHIEKCDLEFNLAFDFNRQEQKAQNDYNDGYHPSNNPKTLIYHELGHWLDFQSRPENYCNQNNDFASGRKYVNDYGKKVYGRVSGYAKESPLEFVAEYISGRMCGIAYPEIVNNLYKSITNLDLTFPEMS